MKKIVMLMFLGLMVGCGSEPQVVEPLKIKEREEKSEIKHDISNGDNAVVDMESLNQYLRNRNAGVGEDRVNVDGWREHGRNVGKAQKALEENFLKPGLGGIGKGLGAFLEGLSESEE